jgi:resuscitation-promoting factor RpfB
MLVGYGWGNNQQFSCLNSLWMRESGWNPHAMNPYSGAYGIPQSLPGSKMASAGADWRTNPATQIRWGLNYIRGSYGSPCGAWSHSLAAGWY